jgi:hypothetical protein
MAAQILPARDASRVVEKMMSTFFAGLVIATLLTVGALYVYDHSNISTVEDAHMAGVHVSDR